MLPLRDWPAAEADLEQAAKLSPKELRPWYLLGHLRLRPGKRDDDAYRKVCQTAFEQFGSGKDLADANLVIWLCCLAPDSGVDQKKLTALAEKYDTWTRA